MRHPYLTKPVLLGLLFGAILLLPRPCDAEIYKYQKNGVWVYTDTPTDSMPTAYKKIPANQPETDPNSASGRQLLTDFPVANSIEKAAACTVAIESAMGSGSGFFISSVGHIITNKHVIRTTSELVGQAANQISQTQEQFAMVSDRLSKERKRIQRYKTRIDQLEKVAASEKNRIKKDTYQKNYESNRENYQQWLDDYNQRSQKFDTQKKRFDTKRSNFEYARSVTNLSQSFTIILADKKQLYARVIAVSSVHDLALLKLDGYQTPNLTPPSDQRVSQGDPVYAIGNPAKLKNSVTAGVYSGYERGFIKTNAQIYPGNSGGPLVSKSGHVIGINTFKQLTHKFEGLGFAIPIQKALEAFGTHLP